MMKTSWLAAAAATALAAAAAAAAASAQQPARPAQTVQQQFDAASAASEAGRFAEALAILEALEQRLAGARQPGSLAIVRVRKGEALIRLNRIAEAETALRASLPLLAAGDASLNEDRFLGYTALARVAELRLDYREAAAQYRTAAAIDVEPVVKLAVYRGLIQTQMFHDAPAALAAADEAIRLAAEVAPGDGEVEGPARTLRGRVLLNMGRIPEAREELERATRRLGGLGTRVNLRDIIARSDLAIAALLAGDRDEARRYLALTGAGRMPAADIPIANNLSVPRCGNGLSPTDVGVVELSLREDGSVAFATPVYASVQGDAAVRLARAALAWSWRPEQVAALEPIFRSGVRVEMRCTNALEHSSEYAAETRETMARWSAANGVETEFSPARSLTRPQMQAELAAAEAQHGASSPHLLRHLLRLAAHDGLPAAEKAQLLERALPIAAAARAPGPYVAAIAMDLAGARADRPRGGSYGDELAGVLRSPALLLDPSVAAAVHFDAFDRLFSAERNGEAAAVLAQLETVPGIAGGPAQADLAARRALLALAGGDAAASSLLAGTGPVAASACRVPPQHRRGSGSNNDFPDAAIAWGFAGWTVTEAQVGAAGRPDPVRAVVAYPPFVFGEAAEGMIRRFRFAPAPEPGGSACATLNQRIRFELPGRGAD
ncbi:MAG TPA: hypothetical protein VGB79_08565 [Allosphingosinicella sp.]